MLLTGAAARFFSTNLFFEEVSAEKAAGCHLQLIRCLAKMAVIILDDFVQRNYTHEEANTMFELLEERCSKGIVIVTSQGIAERLVTYHMEHDD